MVKHGPRGAWLTSCTLTRKIAHKMLVNNFVNKCCGACILDHQLIGKQISRAVSKAVYNQCRNRPEMPFDSNEFLSEFPEAPQAPCSRPLKQVPSAQMVPVGALGDKGHCTGKPLGVVINCNTTLAGRPTITFARTNALQLQGAWRFDGLAIIGACRPMDSLRRSRSLDADRCTCSCNFMVLGLPARLETPVLHFRYEALAICENREISLDCCREWGLLVKFLAAG